MKTLLLTFLCVAAVAFSPRVSRADHRSWDRGFDRNYGGYNNYERYYDRGDYYGGRDYPVRRYDSRWERSRLPDGWQQRYQHNSRGSSSPVIARPCPFSCRTEGINKARCRDWREGDTCFVQDTSR